MTRSPHDITHVLVEPDTLQDLIRDAYIAGCEAVHANYRGDSDPEFSEAAYDYVASLDFTETTRPAKTECGLAASADRNGGASLEAELIDALTYELQDGGADLPYSVIAERVAARVADANP